MANSTEHKLLVIQKDKYSSVADVCSVCSDLEAGILVPVSFCPEAAKDCSRYYDSMLNEHFGELIERGLHGSN
jgi:hypothetical protein